MTLIHSLRSEILKTKRTAAIWIAVIIAAIMPLLTVVFDHDSKEGIAQLMKDPWNMYLTEGGEMFYFLLFPVTVVLLCTLIPQIEYRNHSWKQVLSSPQTKFNIFISKFITVQIYVLIFLFCYNVLMFLSLFAFQSFKTDIKLWDHSLDWYRWMTFNVNAYVTVLGITGVQFWLGMRSKNFILPVGVGLGMWIVTMLMLEMKVSLTIYNAYSLFILIKLDRFGTPADTLMLISVAYLLVFLVLTYWDLKWKKIKA